MAHITVSEAEAILDAEFPVLNKGFIRLVDYLGGDARIVQAARVSYGEGTKSYREDGALIDYLLRNEHTSPFEQVILTFHCKMPIFVARQWVRHRTARLNEISGRYSVMKDDFYVPDIADISKQSSDNKQGREAEALPENEGTAIQKQIADAQIEAYRDYESLIEKGIAREVARINLPLSLYTEWYWQIDLHNLFHFLRLRMDAHAQLEIRVYAEKMFEIARKVAPLACKSFERHQLKSLRFSGDEWTVLSDILEGGGLDDNLVRTKAAGIGMSAKDVERLLHKLSEGRQI